jgi:hypothetical protein
MYNMYMCMYMCMHMMQTKLAVRSRTATDDVESVKGPQPLALATLVYATC